MTERSSTEAVIRVIDSAPVIALVWDVPVILSIWKICGSASWSVPEKNSKTCAFCCFIPGRPTNMCLLAHQVCRHHASNVPPQSPVGRKQMKAALQHVCTFPLTYEALGVIASSASRSLPVRCIKSRRSASCSLPASIFHVTSCRCPGAQLGAAASSSTGASSVVSTFPSRSFTVPV